MRLRYLLCKPSVSFLFGSAFDNYVYKRKRMRGFLCFVDFRIKKLLLGSGITLQLHNRGEYFDNIYSAGNDIMVSRFLSSIRSF